MVTLESTVERETGVTLVTATVSGVETPTHVTIESRLDGPVWPPRRQGHPESGWTDEGFDGVVPATGTLAIGFASPADEVEPPLEVTAVEPAEDGDDEMATPEGVLRGLGDPSPPSVIDSENPPTRPPTEDGKRPDEDDSSDLDRETEAATADEAHQGAQLPTTDQSEPPSWHETSGAATVADDEASLPPELEEWLSAVEARIHCGEQLAATAAVAQATEALEECGGVDGARTLDGQLATDAELLELLEHRAATLAERARGASVATDALDRLA